MNRPKLSLKNRTVVFVTVGLLAVSAWAAIKNVPRFDAPNFESCFATIQTKWPGAPTRRMESLVTAAIEERVVRIDGVRYVNSTTRAGSSEVNVELDCSVNDIEAVLDGIRVAVNDVRMPDEHGCLAPVLDPPRGRVPAVILSLHQVPVEGRPRQDAYTDQQLENFADRLRHEIQTIPEVAHCQLLSGEGQNVVTRFTSIDIE